MLKKLGQNNYWSEKNCWSEKILGPKEFKMGPIKFLV